MAILRRWLVIAVGELGLSLVLLAIAPTFLNSNAPWLGFAIWIAVPVLIISSALYGVGQLLSARRAHALFCQACPAWADTVSPLDFLGIPVAQVQRSLPQLQAWEDTDQTRLMHLSPLDLLR
ncbi:MAG: hypothetical protein AAGF75_07190 [Cyanobacteria bacterium P01_H01_bin.130]